MSTNKKNALGYPCLEPKTPVPSDIEVSQQIVREVGLLPLYDLAKQYVMLVDCRCSEHCSLGEADEVLRRIMNLSNKTHASNALVAAFF